MDKNEFTNILSGKHGIRSNVHLEYYSISRYGFPKSGKRKLTLKIDGWILSIVDDKHSWEFIDDRLVIDWYNKQKVSYKLGKYIRYNRFHKEVPVESIGEGCERRGPRLI